MVDAATRVVYHLEIRPADPRTVIVSTDEKKDIIGKELNARYVNF